MYVHMHPKTYVDVYVFCIVCPHTNICVYMCIYIYKLTLTYTNSSWPIYQPCYRAHTTHINVIPT